MASITKRGEYQWQVQIRRKGQTLSKTFYYKQDAEIWARKTESEIDRGIFINTMAAERKTLGEVIEDYKKDVLPTLKAISQEKSRLSTIEKELGKKILGAITTDVIIKYRNTRLEKIAENSVNREVTTIKRLLSYAHEDCKIILPHGLPNVKKLPVDDSRERRVSDEEIEAICNSTESLELPKIIKFALYTSFRRSEISRLVRSNIDLKASTCRLINTKNGRSFTVPLSEKTIDLLRSLPSHADGSVFKLKGEYISQAFERARDRGRKAYEKECLVKQVDPSDSFLLDLRFHDLRHEAISRLAQRLPNVIELARVTGHQDLRMLNRYYQISPAELAKKLA
jgi:integrase